jgi:hypothetical protein
LRIHTKEFDKLIEARLGYCARTLQIKVGEYATEDRLHNFKRAGEVMACTPEQALKGFWVKHLVSLFDIIDGIGRGKLPDPALLSEKITDTINYRRLDAALAKLLEFEEMER